MSLVPTRVDKAPVRLPPQNIDLEQGLLGALLINNQVHDVVAQVVQTEDFSEEIHRRIYDVAVSLIQSGQVATPATIITYLGDQQIAEGVTMKSYLARLSSDAVPPVLSRDYAGAIHDLAVRRKIVLVGEDLVNQAYDMPVTMRPSQLAGDAIAQLHAVAAVDMGTTRFAPADGASELLAQIEDVQSGARERRIVSTGFDDLDTATTGFQPQTLWIVGARPAVGKTSFFVASAFRAARRGSGVLGFALEVPKQQIVARLLSDMSYSAHAPISFQSILAEDVSQDDMDRLRRARDHMRTLPLTIDSASRLTVAEIKIRIRVEKDRMAARGSALRVVFVDYIKQIQATERYRGERVYEVGEISYGLKQIAKDEGVCIVLLVQLNRGLEARLDKRPVLADLRESGDLEADADVVALLHREAVEIQKSKEFLSGDADTLIRYEDMRHRADLILGKNRSGPTRTIQLWCDMACSTMSDSQRG